MVRIKLNPITEAVAGKRVIMIDDSIVRGTTSARIVGLLRDAGAKEIHVRITAPPFMHPCYYGTDVDSKDKLIACHNSISEICSLIGADSLDYLDIKYLPYLVNDKGDRSICCACFNGCYPTQVPEENCEGKNIFETDFITGEMHL